MKGKIYVLCQSYPSIEHRYAMTFVHARVKEYIEHGLDTTVLSFSCLEPYKFDDVSVLPAKENITLLQCRDILISHAPNIKNHIPFILKAKKRTQNIVLFFHGHEVLSTAKYYPTPYKFNKAAHKEYAFLRAYDLIKLPSMKWFLNKLLKSSSVHAVFVSRWMLKADEQSLRTTFSIRTNVHIINNCNSPYITNGGYKLPKKLSADFITIRPLDQSKYCVDLIVQFAKSHPDFTFHIYGKGNYFKYNLLPKNIQVINEFILPKDIPNILNHYRYAIMPTRLDAQGVMVCEMASYGIPTVTSDIEVCHEMLDSFDNVLFIKNTEFKEHIEPQKLPKPLKKINDKFSSCNTVRYEVDLLRQIFSKQ